MARLTPWFPASVKPVHVGWYRLYRWRNDRPMGLAWWSGDRWFYQPDLRIWCAPDSWQGTTTKPKAPRHG